MFHTVQYIQKIKRNVVLKAIFLISLMMGSLFIPVNAQTSSEFGYKLLPEKLLENTIGDLQVYVISNDLMVPKIIADLKVISSDTDVIQILEVENNSDSYIKNIKIKAIEPGITTIALAAPGFSSKEITVEVFNNNNHPTQILMKVTPEEFAVDGQKYGFVGVELTTTGGLPVLASEDVTVNIETPNTDVIKLQGSEITIKQGEYFTITEFEVIGSGDAIIFAETEGMKKISQMVKILEPEGPLEIQLTVIPDTFNSYNAAKGYAILQLVDSLGVPVVAEEDIFLKLDVDNPDIEKNTSTDFDEVLFDKERLVIKKGEYSTFTKFSPRPNLGDFTAADSQVFEMFVSVDNYLARGDSFTILHESDIGGLEGEGPSVTEVVPFLTTGKEEIIGVTYFETSQEVSKRIGASSEREMVTVNGIPVTASSNYELNISSSEENSVNPINTIMPKGDNSIILFGETGTVVPETDIEIYVTDNDGIKTITALPNGPIEENISLVIDSLIPMILVGEKFPLVGYLLDDEDTDDEDTITTTTDEDDEDDKDPRFGPTMFIENGFLTFEANEFVDTESISVTKNQEYALTYPIIEEVGNTELIGQIGEFDASMDLTSHTTDPTQMHLGYINNILITDDNLATVQLLDSVGNPVYAKKDTTVQLVSNDQFILQTPNEIVIKEGEYFNTFELNTLSKGTVELAVLSEDLPLARYNVNVIDLSPILTLELGGSKKWEELVIAKLTMSIPEIETSLSDFDVLWTVDGGEIEHSDEITNNQGVAMLNVRANDKEQVTITATVTGHGLGESTATKTVDILDYPIGGPNVPVEVVEESDPPIELDLDITTIALIVIPIAIAAALLFLRRTDRLDLITEKIPVGNIGDSIEGIKEKISDIKDR
jgi:hypothetical protein